MARIACWLAGKPAIGEGDVEADPIRPCSHRCAHHPLPDLDRKLIFKPDRPTIASKIAAVDGSLIYLASRCLGPAVDAALTIDESSTTGHGQASPAAMRQAQRGLTRRSTR